MTTTPRRHHVAVVGGGISGLAAAFELRRRLGPHVQITVFEKEPTVGGHLRVSDVAGLPVDAGAESLLARRPEAVDLAMSVGLEEDVVSPASVGAGIWSHGEVRTMPPGTVMGVPADPSSLRGLLTDDEIDVARSKVAEPIVAEPLGMPVRGDVGIGELVAAHYGRAVVDRLVEPLLGGVYAGHADRLSLDATVPALAAAARTAPDLPTAVNEASRPTGGGGRVFAGIVGGVGRLPEAVAAGSGAAGSGAEIRTGVTVRGIERTATGWRVTTGPTVAEDAYDVDGVVLAVPPPASARLLRDVAAVAARELAGVEMASLAIVTLVVPRTAFPRGAAPSSSGVLVPPVEGRTVKAVTYSSVKWPWLGELAGDLVALRASIGRAGDVRDLQRDDTDLVAAVRDDLATMAGITGAPIDTRVTRWGGALPQYAVGHLDRIERIRADVARVPGLVGCGAVYDGVGVAACVASATRAAAELVADLTANPLATRVRIDT